MEKVNGLFCSLMGFGMREKSPNFFLVGAAKSGTTAIGGYLQQHHDIYMSPIKEPNFFSKDIITSEFDKEFSRYKEVDLDSYFSHARLKHMHCAFINSYAYYLRLFREVKDEKAIGDASVTYLFSKVAAEEIKKDIPDAKIIIILRNPVERAFSHYLMDLSSGYVPYGQSFQEALDEDLKRSQKGWGKSHLYVELGMYFEQVQKYLDIFERKNVNICLYDDFKNDPAGIVKDMYKFLAIDASFKVDCGKKYNVSQLPKNELFSKVVVFYKQHAVLHALVSSKMKGFLKKVVLTNRTFVISAFTRSCLLKKFEDDILKLGELINRDLSVWLR